MYFQLQAGGVPLQHVDVVHLLILGWHHPQVCVGFLQHVDVVHHQAGGGPLQQALLCVGDAVLDHSPNN